MSSRATRGALPHPRQLRRKRHKYAGGVVAVTIEKEGEHVLIGVEDAGPGVPIDEQQRIFSVFPAGCTAAHEAVIPAPGSDSRWPRNTPDSTADRCGSRPARTARTAPASSSHCRFSKATATASSLDQQDLPSLANAEQSLPDIDADDGEWDTDERSEDRPNDPDGDDASGTEPTSPITAATDSDPNVSPNSSSVERRARIGANPARSPDSDPTGTIEHAQ